MNVHPDLLQGFMTMVESVKRDGRCKGAWYYGSVGRGESDEYSDIDPVFLVPDADFEAFSGDVAKFVRQACDELLISWAEDYNGDAFKNFCNLVRIKDRLHQLDFFILNEDKRENWWCRQHLKGCTRKNLVFDADGRTGALLDMGLTTDAYAPDPRRCFETYWFHAEMLIKYFKRGDVFKIMKNLDFLLHSHVDVLLSVHDSIDWGGWETKLRKCVPREKQAHILKYYSPPDLPALARAVGECMRDFDGDAREAFREKGIPYDGRVAEQVMDFFRRETAGR
jgi:predicted nucleotidyltransferase